jgi:8-oxo-dGTP diphosphatase
VTVVVAAAIERDGRYLAARRTKPDWAAGRWEFPGGKVEPGETIDEALRRELQEEIGITIGPSTPWQVEVFDYPHALVRLHFCKVFEWSGEFAMLEGQAMAWQALPVQVQPVLPGTVPVLRWFAAERGFAGATHADTQAPTA